MEDLGESSVLRGGAEDVSCFWKSFTSQHYSGRNTIYKEDQYMDTTYL